MADTKTISVTVSESKHEQLEQGKGDRTWLEVIEDGVAAGDTE